MLLLTETSLVIVEGLYQAPRALSRPRLMTKRTERLLSRVVTLPSSLSMLLLGDLGFTGS